MSPWRFVSLFHECNGLFVMVWTTNLTYSWFCWMRNILLFKSFTHNMNDPTLCEYGLRFRSLVIATCVLVAAWFGIGRHGTISNKTHTHHSTPHHPSISSLFLSLLNNLSILRLPHPWLNLPLLHTLLKLLRYRLQITQFIAKLRALLASDIPRLLGELQEFGRADEDDAGDADYY